MKKILLLVVMLQGCTVGNAEFKCSGGSDNGLCASASTIYQATNSDLQENKTLTYFIDGKAHQTTLQAFNLIKEKQNSSRLQHLRQHFKKPIFNNAFGYDDSAVRTSPAVMRVWIAPWVSKEDTLSMGKLVFTDMESKKWKFGKAVFSENAGLPIFKPKP